jgi:hypothetical protein
VSILPFLFIPYIYWKDIQRLKNRYKYITILSMIVLVFIVFIYSAYFGFDYHHYIMLARLLFRIDIKYISIIKMVVFLMVLYTVKRKRKNGIMDQVQSDSWMYSYTDICFVGHILFFTESFFHTATRVGYIFLIFECLFFARLHHEKVIGRIQRHFVTTIYLISYIYEVSVIDSMFVPYLFFWQ